MRRVLLLFLLLVARAAAAHPIEIADPDPDSEPPITSWRDHPALLEWSTWFRVAWGVESFRPDLAARGTVQTQIDRTTTWQTALGLDVALPITRHTRLGAWAELRGLEPFAGGEVAVTGAPADLDMFLYHGEGVWTVRAGGSAKRAAASVAWGYRCPWKLWGPYSRTSRYEIGGRVVFGMTRAYADPADWSMTLGLEFEPVGAIRYLFAIRSWY